LLKKAELEVASEKSQCAMSTSKLRPFDRSFFSPQPTAAPLPEEKRREADGRGEREREGGEGILQQRTADRKNRGGRRYRIEKKKRKEEKSSNIDTDHRKQKKKNK
jgi:hypothetical protein